MPSTLATFGITFYNVVVSYVFAVCNRGSVLAKTAQFCLSASELVGLYVVLTNEWH